MGVHLPFKGYESRRRRLAPRPRSTSKAIPTRTLQEPSAGSLAVAGRCGSRFEPPEAEPETQEPSFHSAETALKRNANGAIPSKAFAGKGFDQRARNGFTGEQDRFLRTVHTVVGGDMHSFGGGCDHTDGEGEQAALHGAIFVNSAGTLPVRAGTSFGRETLQSTRLSDFKRMRVALEDTFVFVFRD